MALTRREFLVTTATVAAATALPRAVHPVESLPRESIAWIYGDPYLASVVEGGLGGRDFYQARDHALRFRTSDRDRDCYVLGLEQSHA